MKRDYKLERAKKELNDAALKHLGNAVIPTEAPDAGKDEAETVKNLLRSAGGDHKNLRNIYIAGGFFLAIQKNLKVRANEYGPKIESGEMTRDEAIQKLVDDARSVPVVTVRGEGAGTGKRAQTARVKGATDKENELRTAARKRIAATDPKHPGYAMLLEMYKDTFKEDYRPAAPTAGPSAGPPKTADAAPAKQAGKKQAK